MKHVGKVRITLGGWYPRTTIHLREVYDFLSAGTTMTRLDPAKLQSYRRELGLASVTREADNLEYVRAVTLGGLELRYYEDGLYTLSVEHGSLAEGKAVLETYNQAKLQSALSYLFSLGAPTPKVLANLKTTHPIVVSLHTTETETAAEGSLGEHIYEHVQAGGVTLYKTEHFFLIAAKGVAPETLRELVEMQIFFREFKDQMEQYLNIHRTIWEEIEAIKEQRFFRGQDINAIRSRLDNYQKTINLISSRIKQMGTYIETRKSIASKVAIEDTLSVLFQYKFDVLSNTLSYIREIWKMTDKYLSSALEVMGDVQTQSTKSSIDSLRSITTIGVISGVIGYFASTELPQLTAIGAQYFFLLLIITALINGAIGLVNRRRKYKVAITNTELKI